MCKVLNRIKQGNLSRSEAISLYSNARRLLLLNFFFEIQIFVKCVFIHILELKSKVNNMWNNF
jgi:hypothetical protein